MEKNEVQISGFAVVKKAPSTWQKIFSKKKKNSYSLFVQISSSKWCAEIVLNEWVSRYLSFDILRFQNMVLHNKIIYKTWSAKNKKIPHTVL